MVGNFAAETLQAGIGVELWPKARASADYSSADIIGTMMLVLLSSSDVAHLYMYHGCLWMNKTAAANFVGKELPHNCETEYEGYLSLTVRVETWMWWRRDDDDLVKPQRTSAS